MPSINIYERYFRHCIPIERKIGIPMVEESKHAAYNTTTIAPPLLKPLTCPYLSSIVLS